MIHFTRTQHYPHLTLDEAVGFLPVFWDAASSDKAIDQYNAKPAPGGPFRAGDTCGFDYNTVTEALHYPGDPDLLPLAFAVLPLSRERIVVYPHAWVAIVADDGSIQVDRRD